MKQLQQADHPHTRALAEVIEEMGRLYGGIHAHLEPSQVPPLPPWLIQALENDLRLSPEVINELSQDEAQQLLIPYWTQPQDQSETPTTRSGCGDWSMLPKGSCTSHPLIQVRVAQFGQVPCSGVSALSIKQAA